MTRRRECRALAAVLAAAVVTQARVVTAAEPRPIPPSERPGLGPADPRRPVDMAEAPWNALGRVQTEVGSRCTGALIGPRLVLTAAHCLLGPQSRQPVQPASVHFLLGYATGRWVAEARAASFVLGPGFDPAARGPAGADWALITLASDLGPGTRPLDRSPAPPAPGTALLLGGYQQDRPEVLMADPSCPARGTARDEAGLPVLVHDCSATRGASGAPLLMRLDGGGWGIVGIASRSLRGAAGGIAVPISAISR